MVLESDDPGRSIAGVVLPDGRRGMQPAVMDDSGEWQLEGDLLMVEPSWGAP